MAASMGATTGASLPSRSAGRGLFRGILIVGVGLLALVGLNRVGDLLPSLGNPFATESIDRTGPALLKALEDVNEYHATTANLQVMVDIEKDARFVPAFIKGERAVMAATGQVDAVVDFSGLGPDAVRMVDGEAHITLPAPRLSDARIDTEHTRVVSRSRGLLDRIGSVFSDSPTGDRSLYLVAEQKLRAAAASDPEIIERAERNTRVMLTRLARSLGVERVTVTFTRVPA